MIEKELFWALVGLLVVLLVVAAAIGAGEYILNNWVINN